MKIIRRLFASILIVLGSSTSWGQFVPTAFKAASAGTNISFLGGGTNMLSSGTTNPVTYTCASTSNRLIVTADGNGTTLTYTLSDTGGQASGATVLLSETAAGGDTLKSWNMGCSASSNTVTLNISTNAASIFTMSEYSGVGTGGDGSAAATGSSTSCSVSATAGSTGDLSLGYVGTGSGISSIASNTLFSAKLVASVNAIPNVQFGFTFDALHQLSGSLTFNPTFPSAASSSRCLIVNVPGTAGTSPGFFPTLSQGSGGCTSTSPATLPLPANVTSGNILVFGFKNENASTPPSSFSDTQGTVYTLQVHQATGTSNGMWIYTGPVTSSGSNTLTASGSFSFACFALWEVRGLTGTTTNTAGQTTSSGTMTWSQTVSNNHSVVFACTGSFHSGTTFVIGGVGYSYVTGGLNQDSMACSMSRVLASGTSTPIFTVSTTDNNVGASIVMQ